VTEIQIVSLGLVFFLVCDLLTSAARAAFLHTNTTRLLSQREQTVTQASPTYQMLQSLPGLQASLTLFLLLIRFLLAGITLLLLVSITQQPLISVVYLVWLLPAALLVFWLEWTVKKYAALNADVWSLHLTPWARLLKLLMAPFVALTTAVLGSSRGLSDGSGVVTTDELKNLVDAGQQEGLFQQDERRMIYSIFELGDTLAREIMVPRIDVMALDVITPIPQAVDALITTGHSRVPVYEESVDNVLGLVYAKDLLRTWREANPISSLRELIRPAYFVPEAKKIDALLAEMQEARIHMAIIVDEYGGVAGLVTLEDIVEEILGEIQDEYDQEEESPYQQVGEGEFIFQGRVDLDNINEIFNSNLPKDEADTLGGFIYNRIGRVPSNGESIQVDNLLLTVEQVSGRRIRKVRACRAPVNTKIDEEVSNADR